MKHEWRKLEKNLYLPKPIPELIDVPSMHFLSISGQGQPDSAVFQDCVSALYSLSYGIKMAPKKGLVIPGYYDYSVYPLEGVWDLDDTGKELQRAGTQIHELRDHFVFQVMIRQPEFVTEDLVKQIKEMKQSSDDNPLLSDVKLIQIEEGRCCQMLHIGPYLDEPASFLRMEQFAQANGYQRSHHTHREIYVTDPSKTAPDKLKTTLRFTVIPTVMQ